MALFSIAHHNDEFAFVKRLTLQRIYDAAKEQRIKVTVGTPGRPPPPPELTH